MTASDELHLLCYWQQLGNKWVKIANLMGRSENWVKNNWKKIMRREKIPSGASREEMLEYTPGLIEKAKQKTLAQGASESVNKPPQDSRTQLFADGHKSEAMEDVECKDFADAAGNSEELKAGDKVESRVFADQRSSSSEERVADPQENSGASGLMDIDKWQFGGY